MTPTVTVKSFVVEDHLVTLSLPGIPSLEVTFKWEIAKEAEALVTFDNGKTWIDSRIVRAAMGSFLNAHPTVAMEESAT